MARIDKIFEADNSNPEIQAVKEAIKKTKDKRITSVIWLYFITLKDISM
ncbi:MAG: hypothetical protein HPY66_2130 [Firmicutes bacterium]|nr:hypothetical protein [Bacillota bacterium]